MKTPITHFRVRPALALLAAVLILSGNFVSAQVSPYSLSPDWAFGDGGRAVFTNGNFPTAGGPALSARATNTVPSPEASTGICFSNGAIALYTNTSFAYNGASAGAWTSYIRNFNNSGDNTCASSATGGGVAFPDPASPSNAFYLALANDETGGNCVGQGINLYRFTGTGTTVAYASRSQINTGAFPSEAITAGTDGTGGYWLVVHFKGTTGVASANTFRVWHFTSGGMSAPVDYTVGGTVLGTAGTQSYLKFSPCQDKIAYHSGNEIVVHSFNRTTGVVGAEIRRVSPASDRVGTGLEFSPDGNRVYFNGLGGGWPGGAVSYFDIATGTITAVPGAVSWSLQLGPDGKIYTSPTGTDLGIISNPNGAASYSTTPLAPGSSIHRGLVNMAWLTPNTPAINRNISGCTVDFSHLFQNYFNTNVGVNSGSFSWNFGDASGSTSVAPSHTYAADGTYSVSLSFTDATCGHTWTANTSVTVACPMPVDWLDIDAKYQNGKVRVSWSTATEINNDYFEVQRSVDGINFVTIGTVDSKGNSQRIQEYEFDDFSPVSGGSYYRIIQHDIDGHSTNSPNDYVNIVSSVVNVHPNPSTSSFELNVSGSEEATVIVIDILGRVVYQHQISGETMSVSFGNELTPGAYSLQVITSDGSHTEKLIKK